MSIAPQFADTITLILTDSDDYAGDTIASQAQVAAAIDLSTGYSHSSNADAVTSDGVAFVDPDNSFVQAFFNRLEEMIAVIPLFGTPEEKAYYKVVDVNVARDTQLSNEIDHLELSLKKTAPLEIEDVS